MKILVLGANGRVGSKVVAGLIERGHSVVAAVHRNSENVSVEAEIRQVDITDTSSVEAAVEGCEAVVCALSSWNAPEHNLLKSAMGTLVPVLEAAGIRRIISISGDVARVSGEHVSLPIRAFHVLAFGPIRKVIADSEAHIQRLSESQLEWTVLRPGIMTSAQRGNYKLQTSHPLNPTIPRAAVVKSITDLIESGEYVRKAPYLARS